MDSERERDFSEFEQCLRTVLFELDAKRVQLAENQREMNTMMLKNLELERQLEMERRSSHAVQMQLELTVKAAHRGDADREALAQKASRSEVQVSLTSQEISILRSECQKLELQVMKLKQELSDRSEQVNQLAFFRESCTSLQTRVKTAANTARKEVESLSADLQKLTTAQQTMCKHSLSFQTGLHHFTCMEQRQLQLRQKQDVQLSSLKAKLEELLDTGLDISRKDNQNQPNILKEYQQGMAAMEERLAAERETTRRLTVTVSEAVSSQEALQKLETCLKQQLTSLELQLEATRESEIQLRSQLEDVRSQLNLSANSKKKCESVQTSPILQTSSVEGIKEESADVTQIIDLTC